MADNVEDFLEHHGVLGMRWGHHKGGGSAASTSKQARPTSQDIHQARVRTAARIQTQNEQYNRMVTAKTESGRQHAQREIERIGKEGAEDAAIASKSTRGEKIATAALLTFAAAAVVGSAAGGSRR